MHGEDVTHVWISRVIPAYALGIRDHLLCPLLGLFRCGSQFNMVIETLTHFVLAIDTQYFRDFSRPHLGFHQYLGRHSGG